MQKKLAIGMLILALISGSAGCANMNQTQQGALTGAALGAVSGVGIAAISGGYLGWGALAGGVVGALAGGILGNEYSKR
ncbi:MAG: cell envelope biogenesis protein OmpA [Desulfovibrionaceae bacterium]|nr:cell envelope biogenesis protein OmpA [Desulfovibrionaceae bacterium]